MSYQWGRTSRASMALRGAAAAALVAAGSVLAVISGNGGVFESSPTVTSLVPASAGPLNAQSPVQYRGVVVGKLAEIDAGTEGARLTLRINEGELERIPAGVRSRIVPRTLFGDQYVELAEPAEPARDVSARTSGVSGSGSLASGAVVPPDTTRNTVQMYEAYTQLHSLLATFRPAEFQVALTTIADVLRGRGSELGDTIDTLHRVSGRFEPAKTGGQLADVADLSQQLAASAPAMLATLDNAVALSRLVVEKQDSISSLLSAGTELTTSSQQLINTNGQRAIDVIHMFEPVSDALASHPGQVTATLENFDEFMHKGNRTFWGNRFHIRAPVTFDAPYPYTPQECPRYPGLDGPHCADAGAKSGPQFGGTAGPVGSDQEQKALMEMAPLVLGPQAAPHPYEPGDPRNPDMLGLLFGPIARGTQVVVP